MEIFSMQFLSALMAIILIDLVLAGDNAIVIALAARNLPPHLQKKAIFWGTFGAIAVRTAMTLIVVWLLKIPGLMVVGGAVLVWIAYKLLVDEGDGEENIEAQSSFAAAIKTIVIADAAMGLDNVLAVAGAAKGSMLLVVLGLLISIPIVVWGSTLVLKLMTRFPAIIYIGSGVLVWTAASMITNEPLVKEWFAERVALKWGIAIVSTALVLALGWNVRRKFGTRASGEAVELSDAPVAPAAEAETPKT